MSQFKALAAKAVHSPVEPFNYEPKPMGDMDVEVKITHCGICHSDVHLIDNDWGMSTYPLVPGHEIVGTVSALGKGATHLHLGQRVGIGWQRSACLNCDQCLKGNENLCPQNQAVCLGNYGGFADQIRIDSRFAFAIPEALSSENAAPLLCGGVTVYNPLKHYQVRPEMRVGVIGIGGLGHLALQFARAMGCEVTAFSTTPDKEAEARKFGAHHFTVSSNAKAMQDAHSTLDFILSTVHADLDWNQYVAILRPEGKLCFVGAAANVNVPIFSLLATQKTICGSNIGSRRTIVDMLEFAARHGIQAQTEVVPFSEANAALDKVRKNKARFRMVLKQT